MGRINLEKGSRIDLTKKAPNLRRASFGVGWEFLRNAFDLDIFAAVTDADNRYLGKKSTCFFSCPSIFNGAVRVSPDNLTGKGEGVDETLNVDLSKLPAQAKYVYIGINIYRGRAKGQKFSGLSEAFLEIRNRDDNRLLGEYDLDELIKDSQACVIGRLVVDADNLVFEPLLEMFNGDYIQDILKQFGLRPGEKEIEENKGFWGSIFG